MANRTIGLDDRLYDYLLSVSLREPALLERLRDETARLPLGEMQIAPEQGQFMALLIELLGIKSAIEVGTFTGYSALCMALSMPEDGHLICCESNEQYLAIARRYWREAGMQDRIEPRLGPALATLDALIDENRAGRFDFVFIDADKENYEAYFDRVLTLIRPGGLIAVDNTLWGGSVANPDKHDSETEAIREFNAQRYHDTRISLSLVPIGDGLTLARKRT